MVGSQFFQFIGIEFGITPDVDASDGLILLGDGSSAQNSLGQVPHDFLIDRCYIHGNPLSNSKRGVALNCSRGTIQNSYISDFHGVGFDTQAIAGWNGPGPFTILNNYLEAAGENVMFGGADPGIPNLIPSDIEIKHNLVSKPIEWMSGILRRAQDINVAATKQVAGRLSSGETYYYRVSATGKIGHYTPVHSGASDEIEAITGTGENAVRIIWRMVPGATGYIVHRTADSPSISNRSWVSYRIDGPVGCFIDVGAPVFYAAAVPAELGTHWSVKNLFELKNALRVSVDGNVFQNNWADAQAGYAVLFKSVNQDGTAPWSSTQEVTFTNNVVRNSASAVNIQGTDPDHPSGQTCCIAIRNNLFYKIDGPSLGGDGTFIQVTGVSGCLIDHNTVIQSGNIVTAYGNATEGFIFSNNIVPGNSYGIKGDGTASGNSTLFNYFTNPVLKRNVMILADAQSYPRNNYYPSSLSDVGFVDLNHLNLRLSADSPFVGAGTKGRDVGADIDKIEKQVGSDSGSI